VDRVESSGARWLLASRRPPESTEEITVMKGILAIILSGLGIPGPLVANGEWPNWRGPSGHGVAASGKSPVAFGPEKNVAWKVKLPGRGGSTPMVLGDLIVVTAEIDGKDGVLAVDKAGNEMWRATLGTVSAFQHANAGSGCNPSPLTDGKQIFVYFKSGNLAALDPLGKVMWSKNLQKDYAKDGLKWDLGTSPILAGGHLVVAMMHNKHPSFLLAFDPATGKEIWKTPRDYQAPAEANDAYTTPFSAEIDGIETIVSWGGDHLSGHDAKSGKLLWDHGDFNPRQQSNWRVIASAAATRGIALVPFGRGNHVAGVRMGGSGDTTKSQRLWTLDRRGADCATPAAHDGKFYLLQDNGPTRGTVSCLDAETGKVLWETALPKSPVIYYASPMIAGDQLYCGRSDGTIFCGRITAGGLVDVNANALGEPLVATPVAVDDGLLVRTHEHLWCFR
jgi:outer membrane protein assembly factor BamB